MNKSWDRKRCIYYLFIAYMVGISSFLPAHTVYTGKVSEHPENKIGLNDICDKGIELADHMSECEFGSKFSVSGIIDLKGGTLSLTSDMKCDSGTVFQSLGTINGNGNIIELPIGYQSYMIPNDSLHTHITNHAFMTLEKRAGAVGWACNNGENIWSEASFDNDQKQATITLYKFVNKELRPIGKKELPAGCRALAWHPFEDKFLVGLTAEGQHSTLCWGRYKGEGEEIELRPVGAYTDEISIISFSPTGEHVAIGYANKPEIMIFACTADGFVHHAKLTVERGDNTFTKIFCCAWDDTGTYLALGTNYALSKKHTLFVYEKQDNKSYERVGAAAIEGNVSSLSWYRPSMEESSALLVGLAGINKTESRSFLHEYRYSSEEGLMHVKAYNIPYHVYALAWNAAYHYLALSVSDDQGYSFVGFYALHEREMVRCGAVSHSTPHYIVKWAGDRPLACSVNARGNVHFYSLGKWCTLKNVGVVLNSPANLSAPCMIEENVHIHGNYALTLGKETMFSVHEESTLSFHNLALYPQKELSVYGAPSSHLIFRDTTIHAPNGLYCEGIKPLFEGENALQGYVNADVVAKDNTQITLLADTTFIGNFDVEGEVTIDCQGYQLDIASCKITLAEKAKLRIIGGTVVGLLPSHSEEMRIFKRESLMQLMHMNVMVENSDAVLEEGLLVFGQSVFVYCSDKAYQLMNTAYQGTGEITFIEWVKQRGTLLQMYKSEEHQTSSVLQMIDKNFTATQDMMIHDQLPLHIAANITIDAAGHSLIFKGEGPGIILKRNVTLTIKDAVLKNFALHHIYAEPGARIVWSGTSVIHCNRDGILDMPWEFHGKARIQANGMSIRFSQAGSFIVEADGHLTLEHLIVRNVTDSRLVLKSTMSMLSTSQVTVILKDTYHFSQGCLVATNDLEFKNGTFYLKDQGNLLLENAALTFSQGATLRCEVEQETPLLFRGEEGTLSFDRGNLTLEKGRLVLLPRCFRAKGECLFEDKANGIFIGSNTTPVKLDIAALKAQVVGHFYFSNEQK